MKILLVRVYEQFINSSQVRDEMEFLREKLGEGHEIVRGFGLGIGLAVVKKFVQLHNGDMNIQMSEDKKSLVEVIIPGVKLIHDAKERILIRLKYFL